MNPFLRRIIVELIEKTGRSVYKAYRNVNQSHGHVRPNLFEQFKAQVKASPSARMSVEEATRILNLEPHLKDTPAHIEAVS